MLFIVTIGIMIGIVSNKIVEFIIKEGFYIKSIKNQLELITIINTLLYLLIYSRYDYLVEIIKYSLLSTLLLVISIVDIKTNYVYNITTICGLILGSFFFIIEWLFTGKILIDNIVGVLVGLLLMGTLYIVTKGFGAGDVDIVVVCGLFIGYKGIVFTIVSSIVISGIVATILLLCKRVNRDSEIAFGPYLSIGALIFILYGGDLIKLYSNLL